MLYVIIGIAAVIVIALAVAYFMYRPSGSGFSLTQTHSANGTPIYMNRQEAGSLVGSPLAGYNAVDLFNPGAAVNISDIIAAVPQLYGNVSSGWLTSANAVNTVTNASIEFYALQTRNPAAMSSLLNSSVAGTVGARPNATSSGTDNGLTYSYSFYGNDTESLQILSGWKNNNVVLLFLTSSNTLTANETRVVGVAASITP